MNYFPLKLQAEKDNRARTATSEMKSAKSDLVTALRVHVLNMTFQRNLVRNASISPSSKYPRDVNQRDVTACLELKEATRLDM